MNGFLQNLADCHIKKHSFAFSMCIWLLCQFETRLGLSNLESLILFLSLFFTILCVLDDALKTLGVNKKQHTDCLPRKKDCYFSKRKKKRKEKEIKGMFVCRENERKKRWKEKIKKSSGTCFNFVDGWSSKVID